MNITLPADIADRLEQTHNKSAFIAAAIREKLAAEEREQLKAALARAYRDSSNEESALRDDWDALAGDGLA